MKVLSRYATEFMATKDAAADMFSQTFQPELLGLDRVSGCLVLKAPRSTIGSVNGYLSERKKRRWAEWDINGRWLADYTKIENLASRDAVTHRYIMDVVEMTIRKSFGPIVLYTARKSNFNVRTTLFSIDSQNDLDDIAENLKLSLDETQFWVSDPKGQYSNMINCIVRNSNLLCSEYNFV